MGCDFIARRGEMGEVVGTVSVRENADGDAVGAVVGLHERPGKGMAVGGSHVAVEGRGVETGREHTGDHGGLEFASLHPISFLRMFYGLRCTTCVRDASVPGRPFP